MPIRDRSLSGVAFAALALTTLACSAPPQRPPEILIRDVTILSMDDEPPRRGSVLVRGAVSFLITATVASVLIYSMRLPFSIRSITGTTD